MTTTREPMATGESLLIGEGEPPAFEFLDVTGSMPALLVCDHASRRIPARLGDLGVPNRYLDGHSKPSRWY